MGFRPTALMGSKKGEPNTLPNRDTLRVAHDPPGSSLALRGLGVDFVPWSILDDRDAPQMQSRDEIVKQIDKLSPEMQQQSSASWHLWLLPCRRANAGQCCDPRD